MEKNKKKRNKNIDRENERMDGRRSGWKCLGEKVEDPRGWQVRRGHRYIFRLNIANI